MWMLGTKRDLNWVIMHFLSKFPKLYLLSIICATVCFIDLQQYSRLLQDKMQLYLCWPLHFTGLHQYRSAALKLSIRLYLPVHCQ